MSNEKERTKIFVLCEIFMELHNKMYNVHWHPASCENENHSNQHDICLFFSFQFQLILFFGFAWPFSIRKNNPHFGVTECYYSEWYDVL